MVTLSGGEIPSHMIQLRPPPVALSHDPSHPSPVALSHDPSHPSPVTLSHDLPHPPPITLSHHPPHPPAVYGERLFVFVGVYTPDPAEEVEERSGVAGDTKVRPRDKVKLSDVTSFS